MKKAFQSAREKHSKPVEESNTLVQLHRVRSMQTLIHHIEHLLPEYSYQQDYARDRMINWLPGKRNRRLIHGIYDHSGIETRYSVLPDFGPNAEPILFREDENGKIIEPSTHERNRYYAECAREMVVDAGRNAIENAPDFTANDITHVITVSCTGFYNPGPDFDLIQGLGLSKATERYNIGFMGCYAAFPALRMADQFCKSDPGATVLIVCLELCSLHLQFREEADSLLANSLFADGAAAIVVSARPPSPHHPVFSIESFSSALAPEGENDMAWEIGDHGFDIRLSTYVPNIIAGNINRILENVFQNSPYRPDDIGTWAVHPGGRSILDKVANALQLDPEKLEDSRHVLRNFGNMSSVTILFVLHRILSRSDIEEPHPVCAMAFGPGLTIETSLLKLYPARSMHKTNSTQ
jgi:predicted naringenin-chalcone synthase